MCQILVRLEDNFRAGAPTPHLIYRRGDIVAVRDDLHEWGSDEGSPKFCIIELPGLSARKMLDYERPHRELSNRLPIDDPGDQIIIKIRGWQFRVDDLSLELRRRATVDGVLRLTNPGRHARWSDTRTHFRNKISNQRESRDETDLR